MTNYTDVISLERAKLYLKLDAGQTETDDEITSMIHSSLSFIEKRTNHIFKTKNKIYYKDCALVEQATVYDYPIQNTGNLNIQYSTNKAIVPTVNGFVSLTIGYDNLADIPNELIDSALQIIKVWFYEAEKQENTSLIPLSVLQAIDVNKRFL